MKQITTDAQDGDFFQAEELDDQLRSIAESLTALSEIEEGPAGRDLHVDPFEAVAVDFTKNSWILQLAQVQAWLHLDDSVVRADITDDPAAALEVFLKYLGHEAPGQCYKTDGGILRLTIDGAELLSARLDSAQKLADKFLEARESLSRKDATAVWDSAWEEEDWDEAAPEPIKAEADVWRIFEFSSRAGKGHLNLNPTYQRGDVWPTRDAQMLIESILRGIPLPSIIIMEPASDTANVVFEVVDGKQRLTSILRFMGKHPEALRRVEEAAIAHPDIKFRELFDNNYKGFRRSWKSRMGEALTAKQEGRYYFPFPLPRRSDGLQGALEPLTGKYYHEIRDAEIQVGNKKHTISEVFEGTTGYRIPVIIYNDAKPRQIHDVFRLYNKQGMHLNAEEIRNAVYHDLDLVKLLLVTAGDNSDIDDLAGYLAPKQRQKTTEIATYLYDYGFGTSRYKRTKILSWLVALLMSRSLDDSGKLVIRSTAKQINYLLDAVRDDKPPHPLQDRPRLEHLVDDLHRCLHVHSSYDDVWDRKFKDNKDGAKWQELQLIASLVGVFLICLAREDAGDLLDERRDDLLDFTDSHPRPRKTQNKDQWAYIGEVALGMLELLEINQESINQALAERYGGGVTCLPWLSAARKHYDVGA